MPEQPLNDSVRQGVGHAQVGWYGKLPSLGDFVGRRMPHALEAEWDSWLRAGMDELRSMSTEAWSDAFVSAPIWFFAASARVTGSAVMGALAPSMDRVGRYYPFTIVAAAPNAGCALADDARLLTFFAGARAAIVDARRQALSAEDLDERISYLTPPFERRSPEAREPSLIDDILSDLSEASYAQQSANEKVELPHGEWRDCLSSQDSRSFWWVSPTARTAYRDIVHRGPLDRVLFSQLFSSHTYSDPRPTSATF